MVRAPFERKEFARAPASSLSGANRRPKRWAAHSRSRARRSCRTLVRQRQALGNLPSARVRARGPRSFHPAWSSKLGSQTQSARHGIAHTGARLPGLLDTNDGGAERRLRGRPRHSLSVLVGRAPVAQIVKVNRSKVDGVGPFYDAVVAQVAFCRQAWRRAGEQSGRRSDGSRAGGAATAHAASSRGAWRWESPCAIPHRTNTT